MRQLSANHNKYAVLLKLQPVKTCIRFRLVFASLPDKFLGRFQIQSSCWLFRAAAKQCTHMACTYSYLCKFKSVVVNLLQMAWLTLCCHWGVNLGCRSRESTFFMSICIRLRKFTLIAMKAGSRSSCCPNCFLLHKLSWIKFIPKLICQVASCSLCFQPSIGSVVFQACWTIF